MSSERIVHVPYSIGRNAEGMWATHAFLRPGVGAFSDNEATVVPGIEAFSEAPTRDEAVEDLRELLTRLVAEHGPPDEITITVPDEGDGDAQSPKEK